MNHNDITAIEEMEHHQSLNNICSHIAGGVIEEDFDCVVAIQTENSHRLVRVKARAPPDGTGTVELMRDLSQWLNVPVKDIMVNFFQFFGGIDGAKIQP